MSDHVLANFHVDRLLSNNTNRKTVSVLGWFKDSPEEKAIVVLEKKAFTETSLLEDGYFRKVVRVDEQFINDIYGNYELVPDVDLNSKWGCEAIPDTWLTLILFYLTAVKTTIIRPCTEDHIRKYATQEVHLVQETPELYESVTLRHLEKGKRFSLDVSCICFWLAWIVLILIYILIYILIISFSGFTTSWTTRRRWIVLSLRIRMMIWGLSYCPT